MTEKEMEIFLYAMRTLALDAQRLVPLVEQLLAPLWLIAWGVLLIMLTLVVNQLLRSKS